MQIQHGFQDASAYRGGVLSVGNFDGVHRGHQRILRTLVDAARKAGGPAVAMTFEPHPLNLLAPDRAPPRLTSAEHKAELVAECGVDCLVIFPTDREFLQLEPEVFFERIVQGELQARGMVEGPNFCFGRNRAGTVSLLREFCDRANIPLTVVEPVVIGDVLVSSSSVRRAVMTGRIADAVSMLGHPYRISGVVVRGAGRGQALGFGTANLSETDVLLPPDGVYAGACQLGPVRYPAAVHLGPNPTFGEGSRKFEAHLVGYSGPPLYGTRLSVDLFERVRGTQQFANVEALRRQLEEDIRRVVELVRSREETAQTAAEPK